MTRSSSVPARQRSAREDAASGRRFRDGLRAREGTLARGPPGLRRRAREALDLVAAQAFDAAVLDVAVPDGSGYDVLSALRADALTLDLTRRTVTVRGERVGLTPTEFALRSC